MHTARSTPQHDKAHTISGPTAPTFRETVRSRLVAPLLLLLLLALLDALLTLEGVSHGGHEVNPVGRWLLAHGAAVFVLARLVSILAGAALLAYLAPAAPRTARACILAALLVFASVDVFSILQLVIP